MADVAVLGGGIAGERAAVEVARGGEPARRRRGHRALVCGPDTARARLDTDDAGYVELYAEPDSGMLVGAAAVGPDAADWMAEVTLAIRAEIPVKTLADVVRALPAHGEVLEAPLRALAR